MEQSRQLQREQFGPGTTGPRDHGTTFQLEGEHMAASGKGRGAVLPGPAFTGRLGAVMTRQGCPLGSRSLETDVHAATATEKERF